MLCQSIGHSFVENIRLKSAICSNKSLFSISCTTAPQRVDPLSGPGTYLRMRRTASFVVIIVDLDDYRNSGSNLPNA